MRAFVIAIPAICVGVVVPWLLLSAHNDMNVPVVYERDALYTVTTFKGIGEGNLPWRNSHLAAPLAGSDWRDFPVYQWIDYSAFRVLSLFTRNYVWLLNWYWVLTIVATAAIAAYCFLRLRASPMVAGCLAFLYATQPYIFERNISHFNLLCYLVPLLATACLEVATGRWEEGKASAFREIPRYAWIGFVLQGISFFYFSFFGGLLVTVAALYGACRRRTLRPVVHTACLLAVLVPVSVVCVSPTLLHWLRDGSNTAAVERSAAQAEVHGLRIRHLLTPVPTHPVPMLRKLSQMAEAEHQDHTEAVTNWLGLLGSIGFVALVAYMFALMAGWKSPLDDGLVSACAALLLAAFLWCTVGGFGSVFNTFVSPVIRAADRIIVFIVFFILAAYGAVVSAFVAKERWASSHPLALATALVSITALAFGDVLVIPHGLQSPQARQHAASDRALVSSIEHALGGQGMIFQIPYMHFPDGGGPGKMSPFDQARAYIQSSANLRWSWGTVAGTPQARWAESVSHLPPDALIGTLQQKGFRGLWIDTYGYTDQPSSMPAKAVAALLGREPLTSSDGRYLFFDLLGSHGAPAAITSAAPFTAGEIQPGGGCYVDSVNETKVQPPSVAVKRAAPIHLNGWVADTVSGMSLPDVYVELADASGKQFYLHGIRYARQDVAEHFKKPSLMDSGFVAAGALSNLAPGSYRIRILQGEPGKAQACAVDFALQVM